MLIAIAFLLLLCIGAEVYLLIRGVAGMREIVLQSEEHQALLQLPWDSLSVQTSLWREYEQGRWLRRLQHWQRLSLPMQFLLHGNPRHGTRMERHASTKYWQLLLAQLHSELRSIIPSELTAITDCADKQFAARKLARLLILAFYGEYCRSWEEGKQQLLNAVGGQEREQLAQLITMLDADPLARPG